MRDSTVIAALNKLGAQGKENHDYAVLVNFTVNTLIGLLLKKGFITKEELDAAFTPVQEEKKDA